jgi:hypothetical protein
MSMTLTRSGSVVRVSLSGELSVADAAEVHRQLFAELDADVSLVLDAGGVTAIDTSIAQIVLLAGRRVRGLRVETPSAAWNGAWRALGLPADASACPSRAGASPSPSPPASGVVPLYCQDSALSGTSYRPSDLENLRRLAAK